MRIRIVSFGTNWWAAHSRNLEDPLCFRRRVAWFNSAGIKSGRRLRLCWVHPGHIRFNQKSSFDPEYPMRSVGRTFLSTGPTTMNGRTHLLISHLIHDNAAPDKYLVTVSAACHGQIGFASRDWKSQSTQPISVSLRGACFEAMLLLGAADWIKTDLGRWAISKDGQRLALLTQQDERFA